MRYLGNALFLLLFGVGFFFLPSESLAVTVSISQPPISITQNPFTVTASISGATSGTNYVRIDIYKEGTTNYFGETYNGTDWYSSSDYHQYLSIPIVNGQWSGTIQGSLGSPSSSEYDGTGTYRIRIRRYTAGGTTNATEADNSSVIIQIVTPTPTPTPAPTNTPTPMPSSTPTPTSKPTVTPSLTPTSKPTPSPTVSQILAIATTSADASDSADIFSDEGSVSKAPTKQVEAAHTSVLLGIFFGLGGVILVGCGILFFYKYRLRQKNNETNPDE